MSVVATSTLIQPWEHPTRKRKVKKMAINNFKVAKLDVNFEKTTIATVVMNISKMELLKDSTTTSLFTMSLQNLKLDFKNICGFIDSRC
jgi:hypothetical protein